MTPAQPNSVCAAYLVKTIVPIGILKEPFATVIAHHFGHQRGHGIASQSFGHHGTHLDDRRPVWSCQQAGTGIIGDEGSPTDDAGKEAPVRGIAKSLGYGADIDVEKIGQFPLRRQLGSGRKGPLAISSSSALARDW